MRTLSIDIETFSDVDLAKSGVYPYAASPNFRILLFGYAFDEEKVKIIDLAHGEKLGDKIIHAIIDENVIKTAFNAQFERICLSKYLGRNLSPTSWVCTAVWSASLSLPLSLEKAAQILGLKEQKMREGRELIRQLPNLSPDQWEIFKSYCIRDVEVERAIRHALEKYPLSQEERLVYALDQEINDRGVFVDRVLVKKARACDGLYKSYTFSKAQKITGLQNPNSVSQLKDWLLKKGIGVDSLSKKEVMDLAQRFGGDVEKLLRLRLQMAKTSTKKYEAIDRALCPDGRVRGLFQFYGANRTGRWAGRLVQVQNLPQNHMKDLDFARELLKDGAFKALEILYENIPQVLSELIRTAFIPKPGYRFMVADFSAIEARVIAWLSGEDWRMEVFRSHGKIYEASASQMFKMPIEKITKDSPLRQKGKISELALGYGGGAGALRAMGAMDMGLKASELPGLVNTWRRANPNITKLWWDIDRAVRRVIDKKTSAMVGRIQIYYEGGSLFIVLPSGRKLSYMRPKVEINDFGRKEITYEGIGPAKKWERIKTYGPKLVENIVQAIARDLLARAMIHVRDKGYDIVMHCHDEIITEVPMGFGSVEDLCAVMTIPPPWAKDLPLRADGFECSFYKKN